MDQKLTDKVFIFWSKSSGKYANLCSLLTQSGWQVLATQNCSNLAHLKDAQAANVVCLALLDPVGKFTADDIEHISGFIRSGHKAILAGAASDLEGPARSNLDAVAKLFGVSFNEDAVIRPNPYKNYSPKEAILKDFVVNRGLRDSVKRFSESKRSDKLEDNARTSQTGEFSASDNQRIVYPHGCTLRTTSRDATIMMTSSKWALPSGQPICAFYRGPNNNNRSRVVISGSAALFDDRFICKEDNRALVLSLIDFIVREDFQINVSDARTVEITENNMTADMDLLLDKPMPCLHELEPLPEDRTSLIDKSLFSLDNSKLPQVLRAYQELNVIPRALTLMQPTISWRPDGSEVRDEQLKYLLLRSNGSVEMSTMI